MIIFHDDVQERPKDPDIFIKNNCCSIVWLDKNASNVYEFL